MEIMLFLSTQHTPRIIAKQIDFSFRPFLPHIKRYKSPLPAHINYSQRRSRQTRVTMGKAEKSHMATVKVNGKLTEVKMDKKSGTGLRGSPKKGGHGGKWTWSGDGYSKAEIGFDKEVVDVKDPNYEDPEETVAVAV